MATTQVETVSTSADKAKLVLAAALVVGGVVAFYMLGQKDLWMRVVALFVLLAAGVATFFTSEPGTQLIAYGQDSIREVVDRLKAIGVRRIVGVGQFPVWHYAVPKLIAREYRDGRASPAAAATSPPMRSSNNLEARTFAADQNARRWFLSAGATFMSPPMTRASAE